MDDDGKPTEKGDEREPAERGAWGPRLGVALIFTILVVVIVWSLPDKKAPATGGDASSQSGDDAAPRAAHQGFERPPEATCEMAIITAKTEAELQELTSLDNAARLLTADHCGEGCDVVKRYVREKGHAEIDTQSAPDYMLPPKESLDVVGATLTATQREQIHKLPNVLIVRTHGKPTIDQIAARSCFALTQALAEKVSGYVYDETVRRIEDVRHFAEHGIRGPLGKPVFAPKHIVVQVYRASDGTARLLTLGMQRFASPDFVVHGAAMDATNTLVHVVNGVAAQAAAMKNDVPFVIGAADLGMKVAADAGPGAQVKLDVVEAERVEGDPENDIVALIPPAGPDPAGWDAVLATLTGKKVQQVVVGKDARLDAVATKAKKTLGDALAKRGDAKLFVKAPFAVEHPRDGGPKEEAMWIDVGSCDAKSCSGTLTNDPGYATNLSLGKAVRVDRDKVLDWMIEHGDGGTVGGDSIGILEGRSSSR